MVKLPCLSSVDTVLCKVQKLKKLAWEKSCPINWLCCLFQTDDEIEYVAEDEIEESDLSDIEVMSFIVGWKVGLFLLFLNWFSWENS